MYKVQTAKSIDELELALNNLEKQGFTITELWRETIYREMISKINPPPTVRVLFTIVAHCDEPMEREHAT